MKQIPGPAHAFLVYKNKLFFYVVLFSFWLALAGCLTGCAPLLENLVHRVNATPSIVPLEVYRIDPRIIIAPDVGTVDRTISIAGAGWQPKEPVYIVLEAVDEPELLSATMAIVEVDEAGRFSALVEYPVAPEWGSVSNLIVVASSLETKLQASASYKVIRLTQTSEDVLSIAAITQTTVVDIPTVTLKYTLVPSPTATDTATDTATSTGTPTASPTAVSTATPTTVPTTIPTDVPTPSPTVTTTTAVAEPESTTIVNDLLALHAGPGTGYPITASLPKDINMLVLGESRDGTWFYVQLDDGASGWVERDSIDFSILMPIVIEPSLPTFTAIPTATATPLLTPTPMPTLTPTLTPTYTPTAYITDWQGDYYRNRNLYGEPFMVRNDREIDFDWGSGGPSDSVHDDFSVRWSRDIYFDNDRYRFHIITNDGMRVYIDAELIIDEWRDGGSRELWYDIYLDSGNHAIEVEYYEHRNNAHAELWWERSPSDIYDHWKGEYFDNDALQGEPIVVRSDRYVDFDWGKGSPGSRIGDDGFSARWTQSVLFRNGTYRFYSRADDGIRVYIDGERIIDEWHEDTGEGTHFADYSLSNTHLITVEYYERTGNALVELWWQLIQLPEPTATWTPPLPTATPSPSATPSLTPANLPTSTPYLPVTGPNQ